MELRTSRFGTIDVQPDAVITFTQPIIGFAEFRRFVILPGPDDGAVKWLQSTDAPDLAFLILDPHQVFADYKAAVSHAELAELAASSVTDLEVYTLLVVPEDPAKVRTNLRAPILVNPRQRLAKQVVLDGSDYPIQFFLAQAKKGMESREVRHARSDA